MTEQPWETHDRLCSRRHHQVAYPREACSECRAVAAARTEGLIEGDAKGRREGERIGTQKALIAWEEAEPLHDAEVRADERERAVQRVQRLHQHWHDFTAQSVLSERDVIAAIKGES